MAEHSFNGFSEKTSEFMWGLALNNERSWFQAHRQDYEQHLLVPFKALAEDTAALMEERFPEKKFKLHIARIYRDARRLHGRGPYKDHLWFSLKSCDGLLEGPMFWFEIGANEYAYGMGFYSATPRQMELFRNSIDTSPARFRRLASAFEKQELFLLDSELYARPKGSLDPLLDPWYNSKRVGMSVQRDFGGDLFSPLLPEILADGYAFAMPYYDYLSLYCMED